MKYNIIGEPFPVAVCELEAGEQMITESGSMAWMSPNMAMETSGGGVGKMFGRMFSGENLFQNIYTAQGGPGTIAFASSFAGIMKAFDIAPGNDMILQKSAFVAAEKGVELSTFFSKKFSSGLFGGEGFIMQRVFGNGIVFAEFDGHVVEYQLQAGQQIVVDSGYLAAMTSTCSIDVQMVRGVKNVLFGGEGLFNTVITGPGKIWLQTMPISNVAASIIPFLPTPD